jgi:hypothetical protein
VEHPVGMSADEGTVGAQPSHGAIWLREPAYEICSTHQPEQVLNTAGRLRLAASVV